MDTPELLGGPVTAVVEAPPQGPEKAISAPLENALKEAAKIWVTPSVAVTELRDADPAAPMAPKEMKFLIDQAITKSLLSAVKDNFDEAKTLGQADDFKDIPGGYEIHKRLYETVIAASVLDAKPDTDAGTVTAIAEPQAVTPESPRIQPRLRKASSIPFANHPSAVSSNGKRTVRSSEHHTPKAASKDKTALKGSNGRSTSAPAALSAIPALTQADLEAIEARNKANPDPQPELTTWGKLAQANEQSPITGSMSTDNSARQNLDKNTPIPIGAYDSDQTKKHQFERLNQKGEDLKSYTERQEARETRKTRLRRTALAAGIAIGAALGLNAKDSQIVLDAPQTITAGIEAVSDALGDAKAAADSVISGIDNPLDAPANASGTEQVPPSQVEITADNVYQEMQNRAKDATIRDGGGSYSEAMSTMEGGIDTTVFRDEVMSDPELIAVYLCLNKDKVLADNHISEDDLMKTIIATQSEQSKDEAVKRLTEIFDTAQAGPMKLVTLGDSKQLAKPLMESIMKKYNVQNAEGTLYTVEEPVKQSPEQAAVNNPDVITQEQETPSLSPFETPSLDASEPAPDTGTPPPSGGSESSVKTEKKGGLLSLLGIK